MCFSLYRRKSIHGDERDMQVRSRRGAKMSPKRRAGGNVNCFAQEERTGNEEIAKAG